MSKSPAPKPLKLNGKVLDLNPTPLITLKALNLLKKLPENELLDSKELSKKLNINVSNGGGNGVAACTHELIRPHRYKFGKGYLYGSLATIKELKRRLNDQT